jgi:hypothetical protein
MMTIEGIPNGWELVRIGKVRAPEYYVDDSGRIMQCKTGICSAVNYVVVRKIEKPKQYRHFWNAEEAEPLLGQVLRLKVDHKHKFVLIGVTSHGVQVGLSHWSLQEAFDRFEKLDGTPLGIEVTE